MDSDSMLPDGTLSDTTPTMTTRYTDEEWRSIITEFANSIQVFNHSHRCPAPDSSSFAGTIDHTLLKLDATPKQIDELCAEARVANFASVCVRPHFVSQACSDLKGSPVKVCTVIGFHQGTQDTYTKLHEARLALEYGAEELDIVINWSHLKQKTYSAIYNELALLRSIAPHPTTLKLILETSQLTPKEILAACVIAGAAEFDFVKTSTGFVGHGARVEDVRLMRAACEYLAKARLDGKRMRVKASGGIRTLEDAIVMIQAGASRLGSSGGIWILKEGRDSVAREKRRPSNATASSGHSRQTSRPGLATRLFTDF